MSFLSVLKKRTFSELLRYGFFGVLTIAFNMFTYLLFRNFLDYRLANLLSLILTKLFAFFSNKLFVFQSHGSLKNSAVEFLKFLLARGFTGIVDLIGQTILVELFLLNDVVSKCITIVITTILNYFLCKFAVFQK